MTRKLTTARFALIALTAMLAAACSSGGDDGQPADGGQDDAAVATLDGYGGSTSDADGGAAVSQPGRGVSSEVVYVTSAAARTAELDSYQFAMEFGMEGLPDVPGTMVFSAEGAVDAVNGRLQMRLDMNSIFDVVPAGTSDEELELMRALLGDGIIEFISDGDTVYLRWSLFTNLFGAKTEWVSFADDSSDALSGFSGGVGVDQFAMGPESFLGFFNGVGSIEERGPAVIRGVATTQYVGTLDLAKAIELADPAQAAELQQQFAELGIGALGTMPLELWVDDDGYLRRFAMDFDFAQLGGAAAAELGPARMFISADFFNFGDAVQITLPSADEVTELDGSSLFGAGF